MIRIQARSILGSLAILALAPWHAAYASRMREQGQAVSVADSSLSVTPPRDWNKLGDDPGEHAETWTLDGEQLNEVTFYGGISAGKPLIKERDKKHDPLPKVGRNMLPIEIPELLERTYRTSRGVAAFKLRSTEPAKFLGKDGVLFSYEYVDKNLLPRLGEARAAVVGGKLYMISFDAPRLYYYGLDIAVFRALADTAKLS